MNSRNLLFSIALFCFSMSCARAQSATATLSGADTVRQGTMLQLTFAFEDLEAKDFELPDLVGLTPVGGPSRQTSMSIMNGKRSSSSAFIYRVIAEQAGLGYVPEVTLTHEGEEIKTEALTIFITEDSTYVPLQEQQRNPLTTPKKKKRPTVRL